MIVSQEFIKMAKASREIQDLREHKLEVGDYYTDDDETVQLYLDSENKLSCFTWLPRLDQLLPMVPRLTDSPEGSKRIFEALHNSYYIPNKKHSYETIEEHIFSYVMYKCYGKVWIPKIDKNGEETRWNHWVEEKKINAEKLEKLIGFSGDEESDYRTFPISENGSIVGLRTERYKYNFETDSVEVLEVETKMFKKV